MTTWNSNFYNNKWSELEDFYQLDEDNKMQNGIFKLDWVNVKSAVIYGLVVGLGLMFAYAISIGDIWALDWHILVNTFVLGFLGSVVKNLFTTNKGNFVGLIKVIPEIK